MDEMAVARHWGHALFFTIWFTTVSLMPYRLLDTKSLLTLGWSHLFTFMLRSGRYLKWGPWTN